MAQTESLGPFCNSEFSPKADSSTDKKGGDASRKGDVFEECNLCPVGFSERCGDPIESDGCQSVQRITGSQLGKQDKRTT
jgi:hypothetical protein